MHSTYYPSASLLNRPKVSVVVPAYNAADHVERCLDSLLMQTIDSLEVIAINDGSSDDTGNILCRYSEMHPDVVKVIHTENSGLSATRNVGIAAARGEYIGFVDADDCVDIDMYQSLYEKCIKTGAQVAVGGIRTLVMGLPNTGTIRLPYLDAFGRSVEKDPRILLAAKSYACNKIFHRAIFVENPDLRFSVGQYYEDSELIYRLLSKANKVVHAPGLFYHYRTDRPDAITNSIDAKIFDIFHSCDAIRSHFERMPGYSVHYFHTVERLCWLHIFVRFNKLQLCSDPELIRSYIDSAFDYMDGAFPGWTSRVRAYSGKTPLGRAKRSRRYAHYHFSPIGQWLELRRIAKSKERKLAIRARKEPAAIVTRTAKQERLRAHLQAIAPRYASLITSTLNDIGITSFIDFGTLLGWAREGRVLAHDLDIDIGAVADASQINQVRQAMLQLGFRRWRSYLLGGQVAQESYRKRDPRTKITVKIDIGYYAENDDCCVTHLFYRDGEISELLPNERHCIRLTYPPVRRVIPVNFCGHTVHVPQAFTELLEAKYGSTWRTPDTEWVYWSSPPTAQKVSEVGYFLGHQ